MGKHIAIGEAVLLAAIILSVGMSHIIKQDRTVTVRGLAEREVPADLAVWPLTFSTGSNSLSTLMTEVSAKTKKVESYLKEHGLEPSDYTVQAANINDTTTNMYISRDERSFSYIAKQTILVRSPKVELVKAALEDSLKLAGEGIAVAQEYDSKISYEFTGLNEIKPEMIAEATQNARAAAEQFARDSKSRVGKIKTATQGLFTIDDAAVGLEERKNVRVVTTIEYSLK